MAYVPVPKDLTKVKTKVMFNLTRRQLVCFTAGALVGVPLFLWLREPAGNSMAAMCMMLVMMPFFLLAIPNDNPETVRCGYVLNSHPAVLDGFIDLVREEQQRSRTQGEKIQPSRPSVRDKLKQELPAHKPAAPKKQGPER